MRVGVLASGLMLCMLAAPAVHAQGVRGSDPDHVTISAVDVPLVDLLAQLAAITPMTLEVDPAVGRRPVSIQLDDVYIEVAIREVVKASGADSVILGLYRTNVTSPIRLTVGDAAAAVAVRTNGSTLGTGGLVPSLRTRTASADEQSKGIDSVAAASMLGGGAIGGGGGAAPQRTEGNATSEELMAAFAPETPKQQRSGMMMLPFTNADGSPMVVDVAAGPRVTAVLPISDEAGNTVVVPLAPPRADGLQMLPFTNPDGTPVMVPGPPADPTTQTSPVPGVVAGEPPR